jgi:aminopeptidase N
MTQATPMKHRTSVLLIILVLFTNSLWAQDAYNRNASADVLDYTFNISLSDINNQISGETLITVQMDKPKDTFALDLIGKRGFYGMEVSGVLEGDSKAAYTHEDDKLLIYPGSDPGEIRKFTVKYKGVPEKGLVIDTTKYGQRSFFGDNWPNLARYWLPCVDHPYDKAAVTFNVTAPEYYDVVATGIKKEESNLGNGYKLTSYQEAAPVAMKVVTIGVTKFASKVLGKVDDIEVSAWVYPENRMEGFADLDEATKILHYFIEKVGPYSYAKLANMQAKTAWGGLENAGTIAYNEKSITGNKEIQRLMAHEIAHQWFGNSATENSWNHVWLSEGFATYFAVLYQEMVFGDEKRKEEVALDREVVIDYYQKNPSPVVDYSITNPKKVLNRNTYQKGSWVLHMLRHKLGDEVFWKGIRMYYKTYKDSNAMTSDFQKIMEEVSGEELQEFFDQWIYIKGYPELKWSWKYKNDKLHISVKQEQKHHSFKFPIEFGIETGREMKIYSFEVQDKSAKFEIELEEEPEKVEIDPETWLLFKEK